MKTTLLLLLLSATALGQQTPLDRLMGQWKLERIETKGETIYPQTRPLYLTISETVFTYNTTANACSLGIDSINDSFIRLKDGVCTAVNEPDTLYTFLNYSGKYSLGDHTLTITNKRVVLYLKKE